MKFIEPCNRIVKQAFLDRLEAIESGQKVDICQLKVNDFDGSDIHIQCTDRQNVTISIYLEYWEKMAKESNIVEFLDNKYSNTLAKRIDSIEVQTNMSKTTSSANVTLTVDLIELSQAEEDIKMKTIEELGKLKRNCFASCFEVHFRAHVERKEVSRTVIPFRADETMYISGKADNVTVIFSTIFHDADDQVLAKVFLQEFQEARMKQNKGNLAPQALYSQTPPRELQMYNAKTGANMYYLTFVLHPQHIQNSDNTIDLIHSFRTYLHYHIKCSKAYLHQRMRAKTSEFLQVLNRAKPDKKPATPSRPTWK